MTTKHHAGLHGHKRKGAIQMSLGMIVAVVFAVVLLTALIVWINSMLSDITGISYEITKIAKDQLIEDLETTGKVVGVAAPAIDEWGRGNKGSIFLAVENDNPQSLTTYYYHIYLENLAGALAGEDANDYFDEANLWLTNTGSIDAPPGEMGNADIIVTVPSTADVGVYQFRVAICTEPPASSCHSASETITGYGIASSSLYGSDQFALDIV